MTNVKMKAVDTIHVTAAGPDNIFAGEEFEVGEPIAKELEAQGHAKRLGAKKEPAPKNKAEAVPENKAHSLDHDGDGRKGGSLKGAGSTRAKGAAKKKG